MCALWRDEIADFDVMIAAIVQELAPELIARNSIGHNGAAQLLLTAGDNPERLKSEASFAALCGVSPVPASSGKTEAVRRLLAVTLLVLLVLGVYAGIVAPLQQRFADYDETIEQSAQLLERFRQETLDPAALERQRDEYVRIRRGELDTPVEQRCREAAAHL